MPDIISSMLLFVHLILIILYEVGSNRNLFGPQICTFKHYAMWPYLQVPFNLKLAPA